MIVLETKFFPLQLDSNIVRRNRLIDLLGPLGHLRFLGVIAPAGFGKSTLVRQWLDMQISDHPKAKAGWLTLDKSDNRSEAFWGYILESIKRLGRDTSDLNHLISDTSAGTQALVSGIINLLGASPEQRHVLVLDDFHHINDPIIIEGVTFLIDFAPPNLTLLLTSRTEPAFPFARWKVKRFARVLYSADLLFNSDEARELLTSTLGRAFDSTQLEQILDTTGGWAAALQLLAHGTLPSAPEALSQERFSQALSSNRRDIEDYIAQEVLDDLPTDLRDFILKLAPASRFDVNIGNAVRQTKDSHELISKLESRNLFLIPLDDEGHWFRFHELLRDGALHYLRTRYPEELVSYTQAIIDYHLATKHFVEAIELIVELGAWDLLVSTLEEIGNNLIKQGYHLNILQALEQAPDEQISHSPRLRVIKLWCLFYNNQFAEIPPLLKIVQQELAGTEVPTSVQLELDLLESYMARFMKDVDRAREITERVLSQLEQSSAPVRSLAFFGLGNDYFALGEYGAAESALKEAITLGKLEQRFSTVKSSLGLLLWIYQIRGEYIRALDFYRQVEVWLKSYHKDDPDPNTVSCWLNSALVLIYSEQDQIQYASSFLHPMLNLLDTAEPLQKMLVYFVQGEYYRHSGEYQESYRSLDMAQTILEQHYDEIHAFAPPIAETRALALMFTQPYHDIQPIIADIAHAPAPENSPYHLLKHQEVRAVRDLAEENDRVSESAAELIRLAQQLDAPKSLAMGHLVLAHTKFRLQVPEQAKLHLLDALRLGEQNDYISLFRLSFRILRFDLHELQNAGIAQAFLEKVSQRSIAPDDRPAPERAAQPTPESTVDGGLAEALSRRELEVLELINQGLPNKRIATTLSLAPATIKAHIRNIYGKIGATSRTEALAKARQMGLIR